MVKVCALDVPPPADTRIAWLAVIVPTPAPVDRPNVTPLLLLKVTAESAFEVPAPADIFKAKLPVIVGVANLVNPDSPLGTLAVVPDHEAMGLQAANLIFELADDGWRVEAHPVELPLSVKTVVDVKMVRANFGLRQDALKHIDRALE